MDQKTVFTPNYLRAYTTPEVATGRVVTRITIVALVGMIQTLLTIRARKMVIEAAQLQKTNVQLGRYFSANLVRRLAENPAPLRVGGERVEEWRHAVTDRGRRGVWLGLTCRRSAWSLQGQQVRAHEYKDTARHSIE